MSKAVAQGRSQQVATPAPVTGTGAWYTSNATPAPAQQRLRPPTVNAATGSAGNGKPRLFRVRSSADVSHFNGTSSRVPYNQAAITDVNNPAWVL